MLLLSRFVGLFLLNLPCADEDDTAESRKYHHLEGDWRRALSPIGHLFETADGVCARHSVGRTPSTRA